MRFSTGQFGAGKFSTGWVWVYVGNSIGLVLINLTLGRFGTG